MQAKKTKHEYAYQPTRNDQASLDAFFASIAGFPASVRETYAWIRYRSEVSFKGLTEPRWGRFLIHSTIVLLMGAFVAYQLLGDLTALKVCGLAAMAGFVSTQLATLAHAVGHNQVVRSLKKLRALSFFFGPISIGFGHTWWNDKHNKHHANPNNPQKDPDLKVSVAALSTSEDLATKNLVQRFFIRHENFTLPLFFALQALNARLSSILFLTKRKNRKDRWSQLVGISIHIAVYIGFLWPLGWHGLLFGVIHQATFGVYNSSIFATNHKGAPEGDESMGPISKQILTSRDVSWGKMTWLISVLMGYLDCQGIHHLNPEAPNQNLPKMRVIAKRYCAGLGIEYVELNPFRAYLAVFSHLSKMSRWARRWEKSQKAA